MVSILGGQDRHHFEDVSFNRLTSAAKKINLEMTELIARLQRLASRPVFMSGSGSTVFVVAESRAEATRLQTKVKQTLHLTPWILETANPATMICL